MLKFAFSIRYPKGLFYFSEVYTSDVFILSLFRNKLTVFKYDSKIFMFNLNIRPIFKAK